ncbi:MAG: TfoX/Sxy family protein [Acidovorax sp.]|uniref:TfoX/Sxy family protein n=1 Tax=Acidovorax sp. TaxID=1872122 RepID=UPI00391D5625
MPARPLSDETLHLIDAVRTALAHRSDVEERPLFGTHAFFVDGKMCIAVKGEELLVRLPPDRHGELQEMQNTRELSPGGGMKGYFWVEPNGYATRAQWTYWVDEALAYNPLAKATPPRKAKAPVAAKKAPVPKTPPKTTAKAAASKKHSIFEADD